MSQNLAEQLRIMLVTDDQYLGDRDFVARCQAAITGGVTMVQLRLKSIPDREFLALARAVVAALPVPVIVNDRLDIALLAGAAGVHLGSDDMPPDVARRLAPPPFLIGASVGSAAEIPRGAEADYWGIGPYRPSQTKPDAGAALGHEGAALLLKASGGRPAVLIGGVRPEDVADARRAGFAGVAVVSGILGAANVEQAAREYAAMLALP